MDKNETALFIMPRSSRDWKGAEGLWITTAGWAAAAQRKFGEAYVLTTDRVAKPEEVVKYPLPSPNSGGSSTVKRISRFFPKTVVSFVNDVLLWKKSRENDHYDYSIPGTENKIALVWEQHDFFPGKGYQLAQKYNSPFVIYVHAPQVWEAKKWGVKRPLWGKILERMETRSLRRADKVACVSTQVAEKLEEMGVAKEKIVVSPMAVDAHLYADVDSEDIKNEYDLKDKLVIGWTGSFRSFHGVDILVKIFERVHNVIPNSHLLLVGDGEEMEETKNLVKQLNLQDHVSFPGRMSFLRMTKFVNTFDIAVLSARKTSEFHYSPMKLREYLKAGKATLAPNAGEIPKIFLDDVHLKLYDVGDIEGTSQKLIDLSRDEAQREKLGHEGREYILRNGTWDVELQKLMDRF